MLPSFFDSVLQLIVRTSTDLPPDVRAAMKTALGSEAVGSRASQALTIIAQNIDLAVDTEGAICQDTGMPTFEIKVPVGANQIWMRQQIREAVAEATRRGKLRPNSVDSITGKNSGDNLGPGTPIIHFDQWEQDGIEIKLILKGGGCENTNAQYAVARRAAAPRARRSQPRRRQEVHPARRLAGAGQGLRSGCRWRLRRRRSNLRVPSGQRTAVPVARRCESRSDSWPSSKRRSWRR